MFNLDLIKIDLIELRKYLHQNPELSGHELGTSRLIRSICDPYFRDVRIVAGTGVLVKTDPKFEEYKRILVRVDVDALPISETNDLSYTSQNKEIAHSCGHDGHTAIGIGLLAKIHESDLSHTGVDVLFQPAEEIGKGAEMVLTDSNFDINDYNEAIALHNLPGYPMHKVVLKGGIFTCSVESLVLTLKGATSHASEPEKGKNPANAIAEIINSVKKLVDEFIGFSVITPIFIELGDRSFGISPGEGIIGFTIRTQSLEKLEAIKTEFSGIIHQISEKYALEVEKNWTDAFHSVKNNDGMVLSLREVASNMNLSVEMLNEPFSWGEDFGRFSDIKPGVMFGLGAGENTPPLHSQHYDFPHKLIKTGVDIFYEYLNYIDANV